jgi:hypothetical protein
MAHFAQLDENNVVQQVIVIANEDCGGGDYPSAETIGQQFISNLGLGGTWKQTSYNSNFRKHYAGIGYTYDEVNDVFISPRPFASWVLDNNFDWQAPVAMPTEGGPWMWNEEAGNWEEIPMPPAE